ncbi:MAG TPA: O-acetyl-ADP-ribose deacetylase [Patescibacteria group bacterium]|nr:O-acetyl-ADP-ribose deacetylase [Patescibacteria group bacterium]
MREYRSHDTNIILVQGDLTLQDTEALVNAANSRLLGGGGVDGAIHRRGGPDIMKELDIIRMTQGDCPAGQAVLTGGGALKARFVIHTVGPFYQGGSEEPQILADCYRSSMRLAAEHGIKSLSFPAISTGIYGYPIGQAAPIALRTVLKELDRHKFTEIRFVLHSAKDYEVYDQALSRIVEITQ